MLRTAVEYKMNVLAAKHSMAGYTSLHLAHAGRAGV